MAESGFNTMMPLTLTYFSTSGLTETGQITYSTNGSTYPARLENRQRVLYAGDGQQITSHAQIIVNSTIVLPPQGKFVVAGMTHRNVLESVAVYDESGIHHVLVYLGRSRA